MTSTRNYKAVCQAVLLFAALWAGAVTIILAVGLAFVEKLPFMTPPRVNEAFTAIWIHVGAIGVAAAGMACIRRRPVCTIGQARFGLFVLAILMIVSVDRGLGLWFPPASELNSLLMPHAERGWAMRAGVTGTEGGVMTRSNALGLRGPDVPRSKAPGERRILFLGDSVTFGYGLADGKTIPDVTCAALKRDRADVALRCINAGVCGYATWQELHFLEHELIDLSPDLVVWQTSFNDVTDVMLIEPGQVHSRALQFEFSNAAHWSGAVRAMTTLRARRHWRHALDAVQWNEDPERIAAVRDRAFHDVFAEPPSEIMRTAWSRQMADLTRVEEYFRKRGLAWVMVLMPPLSQFDPRAAGLRPQRRFHDWAKERGAALLDVLPIFEKYVQSGAGPAESLYIDDGHPSALGVALIAEALAERIRECEPLNLRHLEDHRP